MTPIKEKGRLLEGSPIPKIIPRQEFPEFREPLYEIQALRLAARFGFRPETAVTIAQLAFAAGCAR